MAKRNPTAALLANASHEVIALACSGPKVVPNGRPRCSHGVLRSGSGPVTPIIYSSNSTPLSDLETALTSKRKISSNFPEKYYLPESLSANVNDFNKKLVQMHILANLRVLIFGRRLLRLSMLPISTGAVSCRSFGGFTSEI